MADEPKTRRPDFTCARLQPRRARRRLKPLSLASAWGYLYYDALP